MNFEILILNGTFDIHTYTLRVGSEIVCCCYKMNNDFIIFPLYLHVEY